MKKLKMMMLSFAILAIVGAALAFSAKNITAYCTTVSNPSGVDFCTVQAGVKSTCPNVAPGKSGVSPDPIFCYTIDNIGGHDCKDNGGNWLQCGTTTTLTDQD